MLVDVHQHLWSQPFVAALAERSELPFVRRIGSAATLHLAGESPYVIDTEAESPARRSSLVTAAGLDRALVSISSPLGVEALPRNEALTLIDAYAKGAASLPDEFAAWGALALERASAVDVDAQLDRGFVGVSVPAGALRDPGSVRALAGSLGRLQERGAPLFVHPGPGLGDRAVVGEAAGDEPPWWRALNGYVSQMQAAWLSFVTRGRAEFPSLKVVFAMLAGGAPLLSERLAARGGPSILIRDEGLWYDCSSYGPVAVDAMAQLVGESQLLYGSDRPVVQPTSSGRDARLQANGAWLLERG